LTPAVTPTVIPGSASTRTIPATEVDRLSHQPDVVRDFGCGLLSDSGVGCPGELGFPYVAAQAV